MIGDPAFADYDDGMEAPMPDWFDDDFVQAVVDVGGKLPDPRRGYGTRPESKAKALVRCLRMVKK